MSKIAIVTGASRGIGRGIALKLAQEGYDIAFSFFSAAQNAEELCHEIQSTTAQHCAMYCVDMREEGAGAKFINQVSEELGAPSVLVNNAGRTRMENILDDNAGNSGRTGQSRLKKLFVLHAGSCHSDGSCENLRQYY